MKTTGIQKTASELFSEFLEQVGKGDAETASELFATDGYIDAPYVQSLGFPSKIAGRTAIAQSLAQVKAAAPDFHFINFKIVMETPDELVAEYESEAVMASGKPYKQSYIAHVTAKEGKIISHKEYLNTIVFVEAFFPNGLNDLITNK